MVKLLFGEGPQGDGAEQTCLDALAAQRVDSFLTHTGHTSEGHQQVVGVVTQIFLVAHFSLADGGILLLHVEVALLHHVGVHFKRRENVGLAVFQSVSVDGPGTFGGNLFLSAAGLDGWQDDLLHHLADHTVRENHGRVAVFESQLKRQVNKVGHLLHRVRRQYNDVVVAIAAAHGSLAIVALTGLNGAQTGAAALYVDNQGRNLSRRHVADTFLHQGNTRTGGRSHDSLARTSAAIEHIDGGHFAFGLQHHHTARFPGLQFRQCFQHFRLWGNGITEVTVASAADGCVGNGLVSLH